MKPVCQDTFRILLILYTLQDGFDVSHVVKSNDFPRSSHWGSVTFAEYINHAAVTEEVEII